MKTLLLTLALVTFPVAVNAAVLDCTNMPDNTPCSTDDPCTANDLCSQNVCVKGYNICDDNGIPNMDLLTCKNLIVPAVTPDGGTADGGPHGPVDSHIAGGVGCSVAGGDAAPTATEIFLLLAAVAYLVTRKRAHAI